MAFLTDARRAVWGAVNIWPGLSIIKKRVKFEDAPGAVLGRDVIPTIGDMPQLEIFPAGVQTGWVLNQTHRIIYPLEFRLWTPNTQVLQAEHIWQESIKAVYAIPAPIRVVSFSALAGSIVDISEDPSGHLWAIRWSWILQLDCGMWNPTLEASEAFDPSP